MSRAVLTLPITPFVATSNSKQTYSQARVRGKYQRCSRTSGSGDRPPRREATQKGGASVDETFERSKLQSVPRFLLIVPLALPSIFVLVSLEPLGKAWPL